MPTITAQAALYDAILCQPMPWSPSKASARHLSQKERTALVRRFLRERGVAGPGGVSVAAARGSMCSWTNVSVPATDCSHADYEEVQACPECRKRREAVGHLGKMLAAAFPDLDDRSDSMTDYFDPKILID